MQAQRQSKIFKEYIIHSVNRRGKLLQKAKQRVERIFPRRGNALKRKSRKQKQNRRKADKRKCQRYAENEKSIKTKILNVDEETLNDEDYVIDHGDLILRCVTLPLNS